MSEVLDKIQRNPCGGLWGWLDDHPRIFIGLLVLAPVLVPVLGFGYVFTFGPTGIADTLLFWRMRRDLRKQLVSSSRVTAIHIVNKRQSEKMFYVTLGYQMNNASYVSKNEEKVTQEIYNLHENYKVILFHHHTDTSLEWKNGYFLGNVSSQYPASGPFYSEPNLFTPTTDDDVLCNLTYYLILTVVVTGFWVLMVSHNLPGSLGIGAAYNVTAGVTTLLGFLNATCHYFSWRNATLNAYQIVDKLPTMTIDDNNENVQGMGMPVVWGDDDTVISEESASDDNLDSRGIRQQLQDGV